jgi:homoserine dehydrogenase
MAPPILRLGLIGCGTVGAAFARQLLATEHLLARHLRARLHLAQVAVRDAHRLDRPVPRGIIVTDAAALAADPDLDVIVEATGAPDAGDWMRTALARGAAVVTANKQAVARSPELLQRLARGDRSLWCEGAVAAAVPVVRALRESLAGEQVLSLRGALNATSTFVLSRMEHGATLDGALDEARAAGYAEADAASDLDGSDAAAKLAILCTVAWQRPVPLDRIAVTGIGSALPLVRQGGWRLVASARRAAGRLDARVEPVRLAGGDPLAAAGGITTVVEVRASLAGTLTWSGAGAGGRATASALVGDVLAASRVVVRRLRGPVAA